ncbi:DUF3047 domain-containing protein [Hydrogenophaga sp. BPS33]|uniref:DUF3047 domain-containing protein n=1 Tax=Hydrogenophaga sp. BPS33 TaxID=2651974 RepID=UPI00131FB94F|nr:DUF3047 domain-containing protein [Hydrogenophaga sp. BPS33]QHE88028.1 DUF3047 domain-containing protein [Hydrogenophaga sp. BPS33]
MKNLKRRVIFLVSLVFTGVALMGCTAWSPAPGDDPAEDGAEPRERQASMGARSEVLAAASRLFSTPASEVPWESVRFPGKRTTAFESVQVAGRPALRVRANSSVSILRQRFEPSLASVGRVSLSWRVDGIPQDADLSLSGKADSPVRVVLSFEGDRSRWTPRNHRLSEMSRLVTGEELPYASLVYVWSAKDAPGTVVVNPRTDRIRKVVLDSGVAHLGQWRDHVRDVRADFRLAFGEDPGPLRMVAVMTDTDNTGSQLTAWYGALTLERARD